MAIMVDKDIKGTFAVDLETTSLIPEKARILGLSSSNEEGSFFTVIDKFFARFLIYHNLILQNGKYDSRVLKCHGIDIEVWWDTMIAEYVLHIDKPRNLEAIYERRFGEKKKNLLELFNEQQKKSGLKERKTLPDRWWIDRYKRLKSGKLRLVHAGLPDATLAEYGAEDVEATYKIQKEQEDEFKRKPKLYHWFRKVETPLVNILVNTEHKGMRLDLQQTRTLTRQLEAEVAYYEKRLKALASKHDLNLNSSPQLQEILYKKFKLPCFKKTKDGYSTDRFVMERLAKKHLFPKLMLQYRERRDLLQKFLYPLPELADEGGYVHASFNQAGTRTRRFSCNNPNLQQIPKRTELGRHVRKCFIASPNSWFLQLDYSQIELRLLAHFSQDQRLLQWFKEGADIHQQTADRLSERLGRSFSRYDGKTLNFSIVYGKTAYGFSMDWNVSEDEAQEILDAYFEELPGVRDYIKKEKVLLMKNHGWTQTICGLPLYVGKITGISEAAKKRALRQGVNHRIQGSSQDILKQAIVNVARKFWLYPCCTVHDSIMYDERKHIIKKYKSKIKNELETAVELDVPTPVDVTVSEKWE